MKKLKIKKVQYEEEAPTQTETRLTELSEKARNEDGSGAENHFMEPQSEPKKFRGRHRNDCQCDKCNLKRTQRQNIVGGSVGTSSVEDIEKIKTYVKPAVGAVSMLGVKMAETKDAAMTETEMMIIVDSAAACIAHYLPGMLGEHTDLIVLMSCFGQWGIRVWFLRQQRLEELRAEYRAKYGSPESEKTQPAPLQ